MIFILISAIIIVVIVALYIRENRYTRIVRQNSCALKKLEKINGSYRFSDCENLDEEHTYDNSAFFDTISCEDYLIYRLQFQQYRILREINKVKINKQKYEEYIREVSRAAVFGELAVPKKYREKKLAAIEKKLFRLQVITPATEFTLTVTLHCAKMSGEIYATKRAIFDAKEIKSLIGRLNDKRGNFYNDRGVWNALCRVERGKVSNKMRFSVYERDGYRCKICGRSGKFHDLEIDHIQPISKGGKSTYDNLQTLCRYCNKMKGNNY